MRSRVSVGTPCPVRGGGEGRGGGVRWGGGGKGK